MMEPQDFLGRFVAKLKENQIPYMVSGSFASSFYGQPRSTNDIDIVIDLDISQLKALENSLSEECYFSFEAALDALKRRTQFNIIDYKTGWKIDFILRKERSFSIEEFQRRRNELIAGLELVLVLRRFYFKQIRMDEERCNRATISRCFGNCRGSMGFFG